MYIVHAKKCVPAKIPPPCVLGVHPRFVLKGHCVQTFQANIYIHKGFYLVSRANKRYVTELLLSANLSFIMPPVRKFFTKPFTSEKKGQPLSCGRLKFTEDHQEPDEDVQVH
jgi:hypothetical protein